MIKKERQSNVELLKIIAIVFIVLSHSMPNGIDTNIDSIINLHLVPQNIQIVVLQVLNFLGHVGNDIFIICSCWFLIDSKKVNANKVVSLIGQAFFVSVFSLGLFSLMGYKFPLLYTIKQFFPIVFGNSWFLSCYILLYAIHPLLNIIINNLSKRQLCAVSLLMFILYYGVYFVLKNDGYYYSRLIGFIVLYFFVAYFKLYLQKFLINKRNSTIMIIIGFILSVGGVLLSDIVLSYTGIGFYGRWDSLMNPIFVLLAMGGLGLSLCYSFSNKLINYFSGLSLLIYLFHSNRIIRDYVRFDYFNYIFKQYSYSNVLCWCLLFALMSLTYGVVLGVLYKTFIKNIIDKLSLSIYSIIQRCLNRIIMWITSIRN